MQVTCAQGYTGGKTTYACNAVNNIATYQQQGPRAECVLDRTCSQYACAPGTLRANGVDAKLCTDDANCQNMCCIQQTPPPSMWTRASDLRSPFMSYAILFADSVKQASF